MSERVTVEYVLHDRISRKLEKIQRAAGKTELQLAALDARLKSISNPSAANKFAQNWEKSFRKFDKATGNSTRKVQSHNRALESLGKTSDKSASSIDRATVAMRGQHSAATNAARSIRSQRDATRSLRDNQKSLEKHLERTSHNVEKQRKTTLLASNEMANFASHLRAARDGEQGLSRAMRDKNASLDVQIRHMKRWDGVTRTARQGQNKFWKDIRKTIKEVQDYNFFEDGFKSGALMFQSFTKLLGILPAVSTGLAGIGTMINGIATGATALGASLGRLAGAIGAVGGAYASAGIAAGVGQQTIKQLFTPMEKNGQKIKQLNQQIAAAGRTLAAANTAQARASQARSNALENAQARVNNAKGSKAKESANRALAQAQSRIASSSASAANAQAHLNALTEQRNKLMKVTNSRADEFNDALLDLKQNWQDLFSGDANTNINFALSQFTRINYVIAQMGPSVQKVQAAIRGLISSGLGVITNPQNMGMMQQSFSESARFVNIMGSILQKIAPLIMRIVLDSQKFANSLLSSVDSWLAVQQQAGKISKWAQSIDAYFARSAISIKRWVNILGNFGKGFANIFRAASSVTNSFETDLGSLSERFKDWTGEAGNMRKMQVFFSGSYEIFKALARVGQSILNMFGSMGGGGLPKRTADNTQAVVHFLDQLGSGIERFGRYSGKNLKSVGSALSNVYTQLGKLAGTADTAGTVSFILNTIATGLKYLTDFTSKTGADSFLKYILQFRILMYAAGFATGNVLGPLSRFKKLMGGLFDGLGTFLGRYGGMMGKMGGAFGKAGGAFGKVGRAVGRLSATLVEIVASVPIQVIPIGGSLGPGGAVGSSGRAAAGGGALGGALARSGALGRGVGQRTVGGAYQAGYLRARAQGAGRLSSNVRGFRGAFKQARYGGGIGRSIGAARSGLSGAGLKTAASRMGGNILLPVGMALTAYDAQKILRSNASGSQKAQGLGQLGAVTGGAMAGGTLGSALGPLGMVGGAAVGAVGGMTVAPIAGYAADKIYGVSKNQKKEAYYDKHIAAMRAVSDAKKEVYAQRKDIYASTISTLDLTNQQNKLQAKLLSEQAGITSKDASSIVEVIRQQQTQDRYNTLLKAVSTGPLKASDSYKKLAANLGLETSDINRAIAARKARDRQRAQLASDMRLGIFRDTTTGTVYQTQSGAAQQALDQGKGLVAASQVAMGKKPTASKSPFGMPSFMQPSGPKRISQNELNARRANAASGRSSGLASNVSPLNQASADLIALSNNLNSVSITDPNSKYYQDMGAASKKIDTLMGSVNSSMSGQLNALYNTTSVVGDQIADSMESWQKRSNAATRGVIIPTAPSPAPVKTVAGKARGGYISGDPRRGDVVPIMAAGGEVVLNEEQQQRLGKTRIHSVLSRKATPHNRSFNGAGRAKRYAEGGVVENPFRKIESQFGLRRSSGDSDGRGVHAARSYHYRNAPWGGVQAYDYGDAINSQAALISAAQYAQANASLFAEEFFDKLPAYVKNGSLVAGQIGGHLDHLHLAIAASGAFPGNTSMASGNPVQIPAPPNLGNTVMGARSQAAANAAYAIVQGSMNSAASGVGGSPKQIAQNMLSAYGWGPEQFASLDKLWTKESGWSPTAKNPSSGAYGIPQSLPASKMASAGSDWQTNPATQIRWGLGYIKSRYGSPDAAWSHSQQTNWYRQGGVLNAKRPALIGVGDRPGGETVTVQPNQGSRKFGGRQAAVGHTFNTNITVGHMSGDENSLGQLVEMIGNRMAEDIRKAAASTERTSDY